MFNNKHQNKYRKYRMMAKEEREKNTFKNVTIWRVYFGAFEAYISHIQLYKYNNCGLWTRAVSKMMFAYLPSLILFFF